MLGLTAVGDVIIDYTPIEYTGNSRYPFAANVGGTATNCAAAASRLGLSSRLVGKSGNDFMGNYTKDVLASCGVDATMVTTDDEHFTSHTFVSLLNGERSFSFSILGSAYLNLTIDDIDIDEALDTRMLYISGMNVVDGSIHQATLDLVAEANRRGVPIAMDLNYRDFLYSRPTDFVDRVLALLPHVTLLKGSREEFETVFGSHVLRDVGPQVVAAGPSLVVMTEDACGASYFYQSRLGHSAGLRADVVDSTGAGDCFMGAMLAAIDRAGGLSSLTIADLDSALDFANAAAAICTEGFGAIAPLPDLDTVAARQLNSSSALIGV